MRSDIGTTGPSFRSANITNIATQTGVNSTSRRNVTVKGNSPVNVDENIDKKFDLACRVAAYYKNLYESSVLNNVNCKGCVVPQYYAITPCATPVAVYNV